jgi:hypothetical protein
MKINPIDRHHLHNEQWFGFYGDFKKLVERFGPAVLLILNLFNLFLPLYGKADRHMLILRKSVYTADMAEADKKRASFFRSLLKTVQGLLNHPDEAKQNAARRLDNLLTQYKQYAVKGGYDEESSGIYNLLQDLAGPYAADVTTLAAAEWVEAIHLANEEFNAARALRMQETIDKPKEPLPEIRKKVDKLYNNMSAVINAKLVIDGLGDDILVDPDDLKTGIYEDETPEEQRGNVVYNFVIAWNEYVKHYNNVLAVHAGHLAKKKETDNPEVPEVPEEVPEVPEVPEEVPDEPSGPIED